MSQGDIAAIKKSKSKSSRRKKKRRTADISDSSSSESDSDTEKKLVDEDIDMDTHDIQTKEDDVEQLSDIELSDDESDKKTHRETLKEETKEHLDNIPFTITDITHRNTERLQQQNKGSNNAIDLKKINDTINEAQNGINKTVSDLTPKTKDENSSLQNEYLSMLFQSYGDDINSLREAPDFTNKSLVLLANVLKDGSKMFDTETLKTIVDSK